MKLSFEVLGGKIKEVSRTFLILSNPKRLRLLLLMSKLPASSSADIHREAKKEGLYDNRETTYRALEELLETKLVTKRYDEEKKELVYQYENNS